MVSVTHLHEASEADALRAAASRVASMIVAAVPHASYDEILHAVTLSYLDGYKDGHHAATDYAIATLKRDGAA